MGLISQPFKAYKALVLQPRPVGQVLEYQPWASEKRNSGQSQEILGLQLLCVQLWFRLPWSNGIWLVFVPSRVQPSPNPQLFSYSLRRLQARRCSCRGLCFSS